MQRRYRVVVAEAGVDVSGLGVRPLARALRDIGFEVVSLGVIDEPAQMLEAALQEDADAVGLGCFADSDATFVAALEAQVRGRGMSDVRYFVLTRSPAISSSGVRTFPIDGPVADVADWLRTEFEEAVDG